MPIIAEKCRDQKPRTTARGVAVSELWEVAFFENDGFTYNFNGVIDPDLVVRMPGYAAFLPQYGDAHPNYPPQQGAVPLVVDVAVSQVFANWSVFVVVTYRSWGLWTGGPRNIVASEGVADLDVEVPIYQSFTPPGSSNTYYFSVPSFWDRDHSYRTFVKWLSGDTVESVQNAIDDNAGRWYQLAPGRFALLCGARCSAIYDGRSRTRVSYVFESWARHPGITLNHARYQNAVVVPPLGNLEKWHVVLPVNSTSPPTISVVPVADNALQGGPLPGFP